VFILHAVRIPKGFVPIGHQVIVLDRSIKLALTEVDDGAADSIVEVPDIAEPTLQNVTAEMVAPGSVQRWSWTTTPGRSVNADLSLLITVRLVAFAVAAIIRS